MVSFSADTPLHMCITRTHCKQIDLHGDRAILAYQDPQCGRRRVSSIRHVFCQFDQCLFKVIELLSLLLNCVFFVRCLRPARRVYVCVTVCLYAYIQHLRTAGKRPVRPLTAPYNECVYACTECVYACKECVYACKECV